MDEQNNDAQTAALRAIDQSVPSVARMYDYYLGGKDNYQVDREASDQLSIAAPGTRALAVNNRRFLQRAVRVLAGEYGIRQFVDHGSGLPTQDNVHQIAQRIDPQSRVVYIDHDPIVLAHGRAILADNEQTTVVNADFRDTDAILGHSDVAKLIDLDQPVAALFLSVLHCIPDSDDPAALVRRVVDRMAPGSFVVISHLVSADPEVRVRLSDFMLGATQGNWGRVREAADVQGYFGDLELLSPGLVEVSTWRPDGTPGPTQETAEWIEFGGVARKL
ncbi:SAM-dependent methyltransferase [Streptomyces sp. SID3343]|uniref:SAM-dependent methyltransferase n=1 Tax=Streptomyces sp. SID3343 TaxID=2690260 RepID=UPI0013699592|nr:SAM-dependent methyltransferase [Streptomyces sp. SID3343]MYV99369.1 SAM-dependent methyltransferase [Streptomyces sp. SID3343]